MRSLTGGFPIGASLFRMQLGRSQRYKILALLILIQQVKPIKAYIGEIFEAPVDQIIFPDTNATFFCQGRGTVEWAINGTFLTTKSAKINFQQKGFVQKMVKLNSGWNTPNEFNITLTALGSVDKNNTVIQCRAYGTVPGAVERNATLIIAGPPQPPAPEVEVFNATTLRFYWEAPFSWEAFPVEAYMIRLQNTSSGETLRLVNETSTVLEYWYQQDAVSESCDSHKLKFTIIAINAVGGSGMGSVTGGFPIATKDEEANKVLHLAIPSIGGTVAICMVIVIFTAAGYYFKHKHRNGALKHVKPGPMVTNPTNEGAGDPFYDIISGVEPSNQDPHIISPMSTGSRYVFEPCLSNTPPKQELEPERKESKCIKNSAWSEMGGAKGDYYTIMSSAGTLSRLMITGSLLAPPPSTAAVVDRQ